MCTDSFSFSSSKNWSIRNTNSRLKEVIAAPQIGNASVISIFEHRSSNTDLQTQIHHRKKRRKNQAKRKTAHNLNSNKQRRSMKPERQIWSHGVSTTSNSSRIYKFLRIAEAPSSRNSRVWKAADKRRRENGETRSRYLDELFRGVYRFLLTHRR